jgi:formylglycine-generating enzyme required for sulfatase activity
MARPECIDFRIPPNDILLEMIVVPAGACRRFSDEADSVVAVDAPPITVPQPFLLGKYPVSVAQWAAVAGQDDVLETLTAESSWLRDAVGRVSGSLENRTPAQSVTCDMAAMFCDRLSGVTGTRFTLPTEDEWEYACRDGRDAPFPVGDPDRYPQRYYGTSSVCREYIDAGPLPGTIPANQFGLLGMQAYLPQWCLVQSSSDSEPQYALRGSSRNSNFGRPQPAWYRGGSPRRGHDKSGGYGFRVRCDWVGG